MQTLGTIEELTPKITKGQPFAYKFKGRNNKASLRVINDKNLNYQWTLYKNLDGGGL